MRSFAAERGFFQLRGSRHVDSNFALLQERSLSSHSPIAFVSPRGMQLETRFVTFEDVLRAISGNVALGFRGIHLQTSVFFVPPFAPRIPPGIRQTLAENFAAANQHVNVEPLRPMPAALDGREVADPVEIPHVTDRIEFSENILMNEACEASDRSFDRFRSEGLSKRERDEIGPGIIGEQTDSRIDVLFALIQPALLFLTQFDLKLRLLFLLRLTPLTPATATFPSTATPIPS